MKHLKNINKKTTVTVNKLSEKDEIDSIKKKYACNNDIDVKKLNIFNTIKINESTNNEADITELVVYTDGSFHSKINKSLLFCNSDTRR